MNGLVSATPSPSVIRLAVGGYLLLLVLAALILLAPERADPRGVAALVALMALACLIAAIAGVPDATETRRRRYHGR